MQGCSRRHRSTSGLRLCTNCMHRVHHVQEGGADDVTRLLIALYSRPRRHTRIGRGSDDGGGLLLSLLPCDASRDGTTPLSAHRHLLRALYLLKTDESRAGAEQVLMQGCSRRHRSTSGMPLCHQLHAPCVPHGSEERRADDVTRLLID